VHPTVDHPPHNQEDVHDQQGEVEDNQGREKKGVIISAIE